MKVKKELYLKAKELAESTKVIFEDAVKNKSQYKVDELAWRAIDMAGALNNAVLLLLSSFVKDEDFNPDEDDELTKVEDDGIADDEVVVDDEKEGEGTGLDDDSEEFPDIDDDVYKDIFGESGIDDEETSPLTDRDGNKKIIKIKDDQNGKDRQEDVKVVGEDKGKK